MKQTSETLPVSMTLTIGGESFKGMGKTILEALTSLEKPANIKTWGKFIVKSGKLSSERRLNIPQIKRLYGKDYIKQVQAKIISKFLK